MKKLFNASQFVATKWDSAEDKAKFANHFVRFIKSGFKETLFYNWFYTRLSMCNSHIAHYNKTGFYDTWFAETSFQNNFLQKWADFTCYGDPTYTYSDVEKVLKDWVQKLLAG